MCVIDFMHNNDAICIVETEDGTKCTTIESSTEITNLQPLPPVVTGEQQIIAFDVAITPQLMVLKNREIEELRDSIRSLEHTISLAGNVGWRSGSHKTNAIDAWKSEIADLELQIAILITKPLNYWIDKI